MLTTSPTARPKSTASNRRGHSFQARGYAESSQSPSPNHRAIPSKSSSPFVRRSSSYIFEERRPSPYQISFPSNSAFDYKHTVIPVVSKGTQTLESAFRCSDRLVDAATQFSPSLGCVSTDATRSSRRERIYQSSSTAFISSLALTRSRSLPPSHEAQPRPHTSSQDQLHSGPSTTNTLPTDTKGSSSLSNTAKSTKVLQHSNASQDSQRNNTETTNDPRSKNLDVTSPLSVASVSLKRNYPTFELLVSPSAEKNIAENVSLQNSDAGPAKRHRSENPAVKVLPSQYEKCDSKDLVILISAMLMELIRHNDTIPLRDGRLTQFHSRTPPGISVNDYLQRLTTHVTLSPPILLSMVFYIDKLCALYPAFIISSLTVHRFLIVSATVASKGLSDSFWNNKKYALVGGLSLRELALLELEFLVRIQWRVIPRPEVLRDYYRSLVERTPGYNISETVDSVTS